MRELALLLSFFNFLERRMEAIQAKIRKQFDSESATYRAAQARFDTETAKLAKAQGTAGSIQNSLNQITRN